MDNKTDLKIIIIPAIVGLLGMGLAYFINKNFSVSAPPSIQQDKNSSTSKK